MHYREALKDIDSKELIEALPRDYFPDALRCMSAVFQHRLARILPRPQTLTERVIAFLAEHGCTFTNEASKQVGEGLVEIVRAHDGDK